LVKRVIISQIMNQENVVLLRVQLSEEKVEERLRALVLDMEATRRAQVALTLARKTDQISTDEYAKQVVDLRTKLKGQTQEYTNQSKNLELFRTATGELSNTYKGTQAQLSLAQNQYKLLEGSQNNSTESTKALGATIAELRTELTKTDETQGLFVRNIGNYPKGESLEPLIKQLVLLQEVQKQLPAGSMAAAEAQKQIGFQFNKVNEAAASAGLTQKDVTSKLADYGERLRPVSADLAKLTIAQDDAAKSAGKDSEQYTNLGFQIGAARKEIEKVPAVLKEVKPVAEATTKVLNDTATKGLGLLGEQGERVAGLLGKFKSGTDLVNKGLSLMKGAGETGSLGLRAIGQGVLLTGLGGLLIVVTAIVSYFTQTAAGGKILAQVLGGLGAVVNLVTSAFTSLGEYAVKAATNPRAAFNDLLSFLEGQVVNRVKAVGVVIDGIRNGDFKQITNGLLQAGSGVEDVIGKTQRFGKTLSDAAKAGAALAAEQKALIKARRELETEDVKEQSRITELLRLSKERGKTSADQLASLKEAGRLEAELTEKNLELQKRELAAIQENILQKGALKAADLLADKAAKEKEIAQTEANQRETNAKIRVRESVFREEQRQRGLDDNKAYYDARAVQAVAGTQAELNARVAVLQAERAKQLGAIGLTENQRQAIIASSEKAISDLRRQYTYTTLQQIATLEQLALDQRLSKVKAGSEAELDLQRQKLIIQRNLELTAADLTVRQRLAIEQKFFADSQKLETDAIKARNLAAYEAELAGVNAELLLVEKGSQEEIELRVEAINTVLAKELASLNERGQNVEKGALLRTKAESDIENTRYAAAQKSLEVFIQGERNALDERLEYNKQVIASDVLAANSRLQLAKRFNQDSASQEQQLTQAKIKQTQAATEAEKHAAGVKKEIQEAQLAAANNYTDTIVNLFGEESEAGKAALAVKKVLALAEIGISLQKQLAANALAGNKISAEAPPFTVPLGVAYTIATDALAITAATAAAANILKFQRGGIAYGPSHEEGGIPLYRRGRHAGIEIEGGEPVLSRKVTDNPLLLSLASAVNQLAGGRALVPNIAIPRMALGGISTPQVLDSLRGQAAPATAAAIGKEVADSLRKNPPVNRWVDFNAAQNRAAFTDKNSNS
jgi:hypothetical protein